LLSRVAASRVGVRNGRRHGIAAPFRKIEGHVVVIGWVTKMRLTA